MRPVLVTLLIGLALGFVACGKAVDDVDLGAVDLEKQPRLKDLVEPKDGKDVPKVGLRATVNGERKLKKGKNVYVLVNPLTNPATAKNTWWVQERVSSDGDRVQATCQFGEPVQAWASISQSSFSRPTRNLTPARSSMPCPAARPGASSRSSRAIEPAPAGPNRLASRARWGVVGTPDAVGRLSVVRPIG